MHSRLEHESLMIKAIEVTTEMAEAFTKSAGKQTGYEVGWAEQSGHVFMRGSVIGSEWVHVYDGALPKLPTLVEILSA